MKFAFLVFFALGLTASAWADGAVHDDDRDCPLVTNNLHVTGLGSTSSCPKQLFDRGCDAAIFEARVCSITGSFSNGSQCYATFKECDDSQWVSYNNREAVRGYIAWLQQQKAEYGTCSYDGNNQGGGQGGQQGGGKGGDQGKQGGGQGQPTPTPAPKQMVTVTIQPGAIGKGPQAFGVNPLIVKVGTTVKWVNNDTHPHTSTSDTGVWNSGTLMTGQSFSRVFNHTGTYPYHCAIHGSASMSGTIKVTP